MATSSLRPLGVGEILDAGIKVVTRHWKPLVTCIVGLTAPIWILFILVLASIDPEQLETIPEDSSTSTDYDTAGIVGLIVLFVLLIATFAIAFAACFKVVSDAWLGTATDAGRSLRFGLRQAPRLVLLTIVWYLGLILGFIACILPGIWLMVAWCVAIPALLFEGGGPFKALRRSYSLTKGRWWATFVLLIVGYLLVSVVGSVFQLGLSGLAEAVTDSTFALAVAQILGYTIATAITYPYLAAVLTILYFDQRVRKEGFDLQLLAEGMGEARDPDAPLPAPLVGDEVYTPEQRATAPYWPPPPGWKPPPAAPGPDEWSSSSGWSAPTPETTSPPEGSTQPPATPSPGDPLGAPADPLRQAGEEEEPADPLPPRPDDREAQSGEDDDEKPKRDPNRADWLPPDAPRGPSGL